MLQACFWKSLSLHQEHTGEVVGLVRRKRSIVLGAPLGRNATLKPPRCGKSVCANALFPVDTCRANSFILSLSAFFIHYKHCIVVNLHPMSTAEPCHSAGLQDNMQHSIIREVV